MFKVEGLTTIKDSTVFEWFLMQLNLERFPLCITSHTNLVTVVEMEYNLPVAYIGNDSFINALIEYLESEGLIFTISISVPYFSKLSISEHIYSYVMERYDKLSFLDNHLYMGFTVDNPRKVELKYPMFMRYYDELLEKYPEEIV